MARLTKREVPCVTFWCTTQTPDELANVIQTARGRNGYGAAWVSFFSEAARRFGLKRAGAYRTVDGRTFTWLGATLAAAHARHGKQVAKRLTDRKARERIMDTMKRHEVGKFRGARP